MAAFLAVGLIVAGVSYALLAADIGSASASGPLGSAPSAAAPRALPGLDAQAEWQLGAALGVSALGEAAPRAAAVLPPLTIAWVESGVSFGPRRAAPLSVPEPGTAGLLAVGLITLALRRGRAG